MVVSLQMFCRNICDVHGWVHISQPGILQLLHNMCIMKDKNIFMKATRLKGGEFIGYSQNQLSQLSWEIKQIASAFIRIWASDTVVYWITTCEHPAVIPKLNGDSLITPQLTHVPWVRGVGLYLPHHFLKADVMRRQGALLSAFQTRARGCYRHKSGCVSVHGKLAPKI